MRKASLTRYLISLAAYKICASPLNNVAFGRPFFVGAAFFAFVYCIFSPVLQRELGLFYKQLNSEKRPGMFIAKLMICGMLQGDCTVLVDTKGLLKSEEQCRARIEEMVTDLQPMVPHMQMFTKCEKPGIPV